jgi:hypothetical protein
MWRHCQILVALNFLAFIKKILFDLKALFIKRSSKIVFRSLLQVFTSATKKFHI